MIDPGVKEYAVAGGPSLRNLRATFVVPFVGAFGRDRKVAFRDATHAVLRYERQGQAVVETVPIAQAVALIERAQLEAVAPLRERQRPDGVTCPVCGGRELEERPCAEPDVRRLVCRGCRFILQFVTT
jgi:hypothetical protein